jgi:fumarate reductase (CoM/CoB) subunit B
MSSSDPLSPLCEDINRECIGCNQCVDHCPMLQKVGADPIELVSGEPPVAIAYTCSLCGLCEAVCPSNLSLKKLFTATREYAVETSHIAINEYRYMFPDRPVNVLSLYRELCGLRYDDLSLNEESSVAFFPGCTLLTYSPELVRGVFSKLKSSTEELTLIDNCCSLPLHQLGLKSRGEKYINDLKGKLEKLKIETLIFSCPNCYYQLLPALKETGIRPITIFEALENTDVLAQPLEKNKGIKVTIHDSCPDRFERIFASEARKALRQKGFDIDEMEHSQNLTVCCGSGGQVTHFDPDLAEQMVTNRLDEAVNTGAQVLTANCLACVLNFGKQTRPIKLQHILNLLLDIDQDFTGVKAKSKMIFAGPEGEKNWERIMAEEDKPE